MDSETLEVARRIAKRYGRHHRFDAEDAYQAALLALLEKPESQPGRVVLRLRRGVAEGWADVGYVVRVPLTKLTEVRREGRELPMMAGSTTDEILENQGRPDTEAHERIEDAAVVRSILGSVTPEEGRVLRFFMEGRRFPYATRAADKALLSATLDRLRAEHTE